MKHHKTFFLVFIFGLAIFLRLWNLEASQHFFGDQGRDSLIVSRIFTQADPVLIGPSTSLGNMHLGPLYYYFMLPFLWLTYPSPMGPIYAVAVLGIITVFLMYYFGKKLIGSQAALLATSFFALSSTVIVNTRFSWNPNPAPLVSLLLIYGTYLAWKKNPWYWVVVSALMAILIQLHYIALLAGLGFGVIWVGALYEQRKNKKRLAKIAAATLMGAFVIAVSLVPLVAFDLRHDFLNAKALQRIVWEEETFTADEKLADTRLEKTWLILRETHGRGMQLLFEISIGKQRDLNTVLLIISILMLGWILLQKERKHHAQEVVLITFFFTGLLGLSLYQHSVFDHYFAYLFPVTFLLFGLLGVELWRKTWVGKALVIAFIILFLDYNLTRMPLSDAGWQISDIKATAETIASRVEPGEKYNIVLLSDSGDLDGQNYRYFLHTTDTPPVLQEQRGEVEKIFVIDELKETENVFDLPVYEITVFTESEVAEVYQMPDGPEITVLVKSPLDE